MAYQPPYLDNSGVHTPIYTDILDMLILEYKRIFGQDIYLGTDTQDYQMLSLFALSYDDAMSALRDSFTSRHPDYAQGAALDILLPLNGLTRIKATSSEVELTLTGVQNATLNDNLIARDNAGHLWRIPARVTLDDSGTARVKAYCETQGAIVAAAGEITEMFTPQAYWYTVTNEGPAVTGQEAEPDAAARARRATSVALPSRAIIDGIKAALKNITGIGRVTVYENNKENEDANGLPPHAICAVCEAGDEQAIAKAIYLKKSPGLTTYGSETVTISDSYGDQCDIAFERVKRADIFVTVTLKPLQGWDDGMAAQLKQAVADYAGEVGVGETYVVSYLWPKVFAAVDFSQQPFSVKSITASYAGVTSGESLTLAFNEAAYCTIDDVEVILDE